MRLTYIVSDESGTASVTFWDKLAPQFVNKSLDELKLTLEEVIPIFRLMVYFIITIV